MKRKKVERRNMKAQNPSWVRAYAALSGTESMTHGERRFMELISLLQIGRSF